MSHLVVAIDGPAGAGKSTVARAVAARLGYQYIDSGAMYRAVAAVALREGVSMSDAERLAEIARALKDEPADIRTPEVSEAASRVSAIPGVRGALVDRQRSMASTGAVVMEGRDIGSVVFPDAAVKIYLDADREIRARRRWKDEGSRRDPAEVEREVAARDERDCSRADSPLRRAPDAIVVDTSGRTIEEVVNEIVEIAQREIVEIAQRKEASR
ncbi:MAG: (d)CMP kinase [Bryobacteraceae bacterium]